MKDQTDNKTLDLVGEKRGRGRPRDPNAKSAAQRQRDYLARLKESGKAVISVDLPLEVIQAVDKYIEFKDMTRGQAIEKALRDRFMRKR